MASHILKTERRPFDATRAGDKLYEFRRDDRGFAVGDTLYLAEWNETANPPCFTGRVVSVRVSYITRHAYGVPEGFVVLGFRHVHQDASRAVDADLVPLPIVSIDEEGRPRQVLVPALDREPWHHPERFACVEEQEPKA